MYLELLKRTGDFLSITRENEFNLKPTDFTLSNGTKVEVIDEATCSQTIFNEETGESSTFSTGLSKIRFPSPTNVGNATAGAHAEGIGSFWELWTLTSNIRIIEEKLRTRARSNVQNEDKVKQRLEQREKEKAEQKA